MNPELSLTKAQRYGERTDASACYRHRGSGVPPEVPLAVLLLLCLLLPTAILYAQQNEPTAKARIEISGDAHLQADSTLYLNFPTAMVTPAEIDMEAKECPIRFEPPLAGKFIWKSETEGEFKPHAVPPGRTFKIFPRTNLADASGKSVTSTGPIGTRVSEPFKVEALYFAEDTNNTLEKRPSIALRFHPKVSPADLVEAAWFQDRDSREHYPVEVVLQDDANGPVDTATVTPRTDLPAGRTIDLIVDGLKEAVTGTRQPSIYVKALGETRSLKVLRVAGFNYPMHRRRIAVEFDDTVDSAEAAKIQITPSVPGLHCVGKEEALWFEGDFDLSQPYSVTIPKSVTGKRGFTLALESRWKATFHPKKPQIIFPTGELHQRSQLGLAFGFLQVNTGPLEWKLARVTPDKLLTVGHRVFEFTEKRADPVTNEEMEDPATGLFLWTRSELLIDACRLKTVASGQIEASLSEADMRRDIRWKPKSGLPAGTYVLEISGKTPEGKIIANRALVTFTEYAAVQKQFGDTRLVRVMNVADGRVVPGVRVRAVTAQNVFLAEAVTDSSGEARFQRSVLFPKKGERTEWLVMDTPVGPILQHAAASQYEAGPFWASQREEPAAAYRLAVTSDRPLYRPGQTVKFKGFVREVQIDGDLGVPRSGKVQWKIIGREEEELAAGTAKLDDFGGLEGEWQIPETVKLGQYRLLITLGEATGEQFIAIQEFRPPPFLVSFADMKLPGAQSGVRISSAYFHGAANIGARVKWEAAWSGRIVGDPSVVVTDVPREAPVQRDRKQIVKGEGVIGPDGSLEVKSTPPFTDGIPRGWYDVYWTAEVTAVDGQTISETVSYPTHAVPVELSINGKQNVKAEPSGSKLNVFIEANAATPDKADAAGVPVTVELYKLINKTAKEQISPFVYRYRNSTAFEKTGTAQGRTPFKPTLSAPAAGEYLIAVRHTENAAVPVCAQRVYVTGWEEAEFPVRDEETIGVSCDRPANNDHAGIVPIADEKNSYVPGEKAVFSVQAPFAGVAWVTVETQGILDSFTVALEGNSGRFELPVKKEYAPNAWVSVWLLRPGGDDALPAERFGAVRINVRRPDLELKVAPVFSAKMVQPKQTVSGEIAVTCEGKPVGGADLTVFAVDEAYLDAGDWHEPPVRQSMNPERFWGVTTYHGMEQMSSGVSTASLHQKGFIIGGFDGKGGSQMNVKDLRTNFPPLAFWKTHVRTDGNGKAPFSFTAPDGLTKYRVIALAQTRASQFGTGSDWVELSKPVQIEPALPRFVRAGDELELRAIVRQNSKDELPVSVLCSTDLTLTGTNTLTQTVRRGMPAVFRFPARVNRDPSALKDGQFAPTAIRFETKAASGDAVEITLPVHSPTLLRKEAVFGKLNGIQANLPSEWKQSSGIVDVTLSTSPWLPKLTGLPLLLEYPHGCFEQITSRVLGYTVLGNFLAYLPEPAGREEVYRKRIESGIRKMADNLVDNGTALPYWPGGAPSAIPTIAGYWAAKEAGKQGIAVPEKLTGGLAKTIRAIALGEGKNEAAQQAHSDSYLCAFALMVLSESPDKKPFEAAVRELYLRREKLDEESRALLAIAMQRFAIMPQERMQLLREIDAPLKDRAFDPETFASTTRAEAVRALAFAIVDPAGTAGQAREGVRKRIGKLLDSAQSLSTQENFWLLFAFRAMHPAPPGAPVDFKAAIPASTALSRNGASALWSGVDIRHIRDFAVQLDRTESLSCLMQAQYHSDSPITNRTDRGFRVERVAKNLTDPSRVGTSEAPFRLGDQVLVTYRLFSPKLHHFVALEDELPAALETVNADIASIARTYSVPKEQDTRQLSLSYAERRDRVTCLYFDRVEPGLATYSVLARATCAGTFHWPATQVTPMYDSRFSGLAPSAKCCVSGE